MAVEIKMPALSPTMTEGTLAKWLVKEGDQVNAGDVMFEIETDKATMEVEAVDEGKIAKILVQDGTADVAVNSVVAILAEDGESLEDAAKSASNAASSASGSGPASAPATQEQTQKAEAPASQSASASSSGTTASPSNNSHGGERLFISPLAKRIAKDAGLDPAQLKGKGTGPHGRIIKRDVEDALASGMKGGAPAGQASGQASGQATGQAGGAKGEFDLIPLNNMRKTIAKRLVEAKSTIPHFYLSREVRLDALLAARAQINEQADGAYKLSVNDLVIKASALALMQIKDANVCWSDEGVKRYHNADISVAVATDGGLITPILFQAEQKSLATLSNEMKQLAGKARDGKLMPEEYQGGSFTISNLGMFGIEQFQAIINPPQACILAVGAGVQKPIAKDGNMEIATMMNLTLSVDHRLVDGALGAKLLDAIAKRIETPLLMLA